MSPSRPQKDLIVLVADKNMEHSVASLLSRPKALRTRRLLTWDIFVHPQHDPGCRLNADNFMRAFINRYARALVMFDRVGCGRDLTAREELEHRVEIALAASGWNERAAAIVLDPELETWVWSDSPHVEMVLGWQERVPDLNTWLAQEGFLDDSLTKPTRPKEALERALREAGKPRSSSLYSQLAKKVSLQRCTDLAFSKFKRTLRNWFPPNS